MSLANKIVEIRKSSHLTQEEFAGKFFVTRQAVSRWENGETAPSLDTLKAIAGAFKVDANALLGVENPVCQSCGMPLKSVDELGAEADGGVSADYCRYCYPAGAFSREVSVEEMVETNLQFLQHFNAESGTNYSEAEARGILKQYLPTLKRWRQA
ncbi:MAG: helix-turn-helix domain-containing protein [Firmicutes bacterium]|nr:helix-turn-helix domain-containing protein [Bacillota bacterium]